MEIRLTDKEKKLIEILRTVPYGQVVIHLEGSQPVRIEKVTESVKL